MHMYMYSFAFGLEWKQTLPVSLVYSLLTQSSHPPEKQTTIIDIAPLSVAPKHLPPEDQQLENESLRLWGGVTKAILSKQFSRATTLKVELEESQREKARTRDRTGEVWNPVFFQKSTDERGTPELTDKGREVLARAQKGEWDLAGIAP